MYNVVREGPNLVAVDARVIRDQSVSERSSTHRCERGGILLRVANYHVLYSGIIILNGDGGHVMTLTLTNAAVL